MVLLVVPIRQTDTGNLGNGRYARKLVEAAARKAVLAGRVDLLTVEDLWKI